MNIIVIPDIHTHYEKAERICNKYKDHQFIFTGDYFDFWDDTPEDNQYTAEWLVESLKKPNRIHLMGNHDECYHPQRTVACSGFSNQKKDTINKVMSIDDWNKIKYFHYENKWFFSHAGVNRHWFGDPITGYISLERIQSVIESSIAKQIIGDYDNAIWASDAFRGGFHDSGGILWQDWRKMELIPNFRQCVGHTPLNNIQKISDNIINAQILNVDNSAIRVYMSEVVEIQENGETKYLNTSYV